MAARQIHFRSEAREKVLRGASALADAVRVTLGPKARCVLIERKWGKPLVSDDGVSIAKEVELQDAEENLGVQMLRQAAERTGDRVGDGTTTSTLLAYEMFAEGVKNVAAGASAIDLRRGLQRGLKIVLEAVRAQAKPVETLLAKTHVATIAAHNEPEVGAMVAEAVTKVGTEGAVTVEVACHAGDTVESAERLMGENRIRRIPVLDQDNRLIGLVSMNDVARLAAHAKKSGVDRELVETMAAVCQPRAALHALPTTNNIVAA